MCWRGWRRKQRRQGGVILVGSPVGVGSPPSCQRMGMFGPKHRLNLISLISTQKKHLQVAGGGGGRGGGLEGFKAALKFLSCGEGSLIAVRWEGSYLHILLSGPGRGPFLPPPHCSTALRALLSPSGGRHTTKDPPPTLPSLLISGSLSCSLKRVVKCE